MDERLSDPELYDLERRARLTAELCHKHGYVDGATAAEAQAKAFRAERASRA